MANMTETCMTKEKNLHKNSSDSIIDGEGMFSHLWRIGICLIAKKNFTGRWKTMRFFKNLFIHSETERERERRAPCREPDVGPDPRSTGSRPGLKEVLYPLSHLSCPEMRQI